MSSLICKFIYLVLLGLAFTGCQTAGFKFQKAKLLDATMDPAKSSSASQTLSGTPNGLWEKGQIGAGSSGVGSSCPTCGS